MTDSGFSSSSSLSELNFNRASPPASPIRDDGEELMAQSEAGQGSPQSLAASPMGRSVADSQMSSMSTIAAPGAWHQYQEHQNAEAEEEAQQLPPSPTASQYTTGPNPFVDLVRGAGAQAYRTLGFDSASSLSASTASPGPGWERESEYVTEEVILPDARRHGGLSERKREKSRAVDPGIDSLPISPPHRSGSSRRIQARDEEAVGGRSRPKEKEKAVRRRRRVHTYYYTTDARFLEYGFSRDFFLIVWLCLGIACFLILVGRSLRVNAGELDFETLL
ncbi:hypothetical protein D9619_010753 [Psilocybe cf. subviscida]|uniref:Uncharacterized protein n=1 Tax=Psilocybe cf. subviscida TaxID=2480587 RepID=A0A8H5B8I0_9AGAR|nr:hypothetical protein D9619_010753 [Psilocybe cf. subviscida]